MLDLLRCEFRRNVELPYGFRSMIGGIPIPGVGKQPPIVIQLRPLGIDSADNLLMLVEEQEGRVVQQHPCTGLAFAMNDGLDAIAVPLSQPQPLRCQKGRIANLAEDAVVEVSVVTLRPGSDRIEQGDSHDADDEGGCDGRSQKLPDGYAGGAGDHEFLVLGQLSQRQDRPDQHGKRHDFLRVEGHLEQSHLRQCSDPDTLKTSRAAHQLHHIA